MRIELASIDWRWRRGLWLAVMVALLLFCHESCNQTARAAGATTKSIQWPTYNNGYKSQRYSPLTEITAQNVQALKEACRLKLAETGPFESGLVVIEGVMYLTREFDTYALDATNCRLRWKYTHTVDQQEVYWPVNRGLAVMGGRVFRGTTDGYLIALDASTGRRLWQSVVGDSTINESVVGAPLAWNGLVIIGITGTDASIKGRIMAFDATNGREVWRFNTIPTGTEIGADTWESRPSAEAGGGGTWSTFTLDVSSGELFVPVGSPAPIFRPELRPGANLFTCSLVVLDARTGALKWWYQLVPHDTHDLDLAAAPMLYINGEGRSLVAAAGKDGYVHVLDRLTHQLLFKTAVTTIENQDVQPSEKETRFCPSSWGGTEWNGPAFDSKIGTIFVGAVDWCLLVKLNKGGEKEFVYRLGSRGADTTGLVETHNDPDRPPTGWLTALDADTGAVKWKYHAQAPIVASVTPTAAGIVLTGDVAGNFLVFNSLTGQVVYKKNTGGGLAGGVITYDIGGKQYIAFTSGNGSRTAFGAAYANISAVGKCLMDGMRALAKESGDNWLV